MARGLEAHRQRRQQRLALGKMLSRRSSSSCELCQKRTSLTVVELFPLRDEPTDQWALLLCSSCQPYVAEQIQVEDPNTLQFLHELIWSEVVPVQVAAIRLARHLDKSGVPWAQGLLETVYLSPEVEELL